MGGYCPGDEGWPLTRVQESMVIRVKLAAVAGVFLAEPSDARAVPPGGGGRPDSAEDFRVAETWAS